MKICIILLLVLCSCQEKKPLSNFPPFYESVKRGFFFPSKPSKKTEKEWALFKTCFDKHLNQKSSNARIPKIIHQIWIGGALPEKYHSLQKTWQTHHPKWEYKLWTDKDLPFFQFTDRKRFEEAKNLGEKSDILRYEILHQFGGLYVDTDFECIKPFDLLHHLCDFYIGLEKVSSLKEKAGMGNALIGSIPGHPILKRCLKTISKKTTSAFPDEIQKVTGPVCIKKAFLKKYQKRNLRNVAFPFTYFYPLPATEKNSGADLKEKWVQKESFGIHYWDASWLKG